jgi:hypothetical protein
MVKKTFILIGVLVFSAIVDATFGENESGFESSCAIHVKSAVYPSDPFDNSGKARVYVTLCTRDGAPIPDQEIQLTASCGTFSCKPLDSEDTSVVDSSIYECDHTDKNGKVMVYLVNIPFNNQGSVTATCDYGSLSVKASCTFLISRYSLAQKNRRKPLSK